MILYDDNGNKFKCVKTNPPRLNTKRDILWDAIKRSIDGIDYKFYFRYTGNFFFQYKGQWFKVGYDNTNGCDVGFNAYPDVFYTELPIINGEE